MAVNTQYNPKNISEFDKQNLNKFAKGFATVALAGQTTNLDYTLTDDLLLSGGSGFLAKGAAWGDSVSFQVLYNGNVVSQFIDSWYVNPDQTEQNIPGANYPAKIFAGMVIRVIYVSTGQTNVQIAVNFNFEKVIA